MQLEPEAGVGAVDAVTGDGLGKGHARPGRCGDVEPLALEHRAHDRLHAVDHVVLLDERHLDVELGELGLAVGAGVLVPEAARDLVVALHAADHQQLLEQLGRLRQGVERARLDAGRHQVIARALRGRARQVRRLDLEEVAFVQHLAHGRDHAVAQGDRALELRPAQVERAVPQTDDLVDV